MTKAKIYRDIAGRILTYALPLALFWCISALCFAPQFEGKVLPQHDVEQYEGMWRDIREHRAATGEDAQWTGAMFGGMPAYLINVRYPSQIVKNTAGQIVKAVNTPAGFIFFAMTAMWIMALLTGMSPWVGMVPALAYGLSTYFFLIIGAGHVTKMWALVYAPLMLGGIFVTMRGRMLAGGALTALSASLEIGANHPQITYYFLLAAAAFWTSELVFAAKGRQLKDFAVRTAVLIVAGAAAAGSNFAPLWYTSQHSPDTIRGGSELAADSGSKQAEGLDMDYATAWSYGLAESWNMLIPDFAGGDSASAFDTKGAVGDALAPYGLRQAARQLPSYWGGQPYTAGPTYLGAAAIFLALLGALLAGNRDRWWLIAIMLVMLLLAWGRNFRAFTALCFNYLPLYNKFRTVSTTLVVLEWGVPLLAGIGVWKAWNTPREKRRTLLKPICRAAGVTGGICLLFAVAGGALFDFGQSSAEEQMTEQFYYMLRSAGHNDAIAQGLHERLGQDTAAAMAADRMEMMRDDALRSLLFIALAAAAMMLYAFGKAGRGVMVAAAALTITADMAAVDMRYMPHSRFTQARNMQVKPSAADAEILQDNDAGYRVYNLSVSTFNDATTSNFHRSVGGYHGAKLARYQDIIDLHLQPGSETEQVLDMLNVRYVIGPRGEVLLRDTPNGAAWFVERVTEVPSAYYETDALYAIDTKTDAVASAAMKGTEKRNEVPAGEYSGKGEIRLAEYAPNRLKYEYTADAPAFAVFSEIFYDKGWKAFVDGEEMPYCRVDYILRGMALPEGTHTVEWRFAAPAWGLTSAVTFAFSLAILLAAAAAIVTEVTKRCKRYKTECANEQREQKA